MSEREIKIIRNLKEKLNSLDSRKLKNLKFRIYENNLEDSYSEISYIKGKGFVKSNCISYNQIDASELVNELKRNNYSVNGFVEKFNRYI